MADGYITIGTELSTDKFDRQINDLEKKMSREEDKKIIIETKLQGQKEELEQARQKTDELADAYQRLKAVQESVAQGRATPQQFMELQDLQATYGTLEQIGNSFNKALTAQDRIESKVVQTQGQYDALNAKVTDFKTKIESIRLQKQASEVERLKSGFDRVEGSIQKAVTKAGRLALGIFGIRSAYLAVRQASSYLGSYDKQYAANLEYIKYVLTQAIAPVLRYIVSLAATLLGYINAIMQGWFGINIFSRGSAKSFAKMKAGAGGVAKAVKEIKKQLAGFDEMNILQGDNDSGAGGGGGGGASMPDFDLSKMQGEPPEWLKWIIDHKDLILAVLAGILAFITALKLGLGLIKALGIGILVAGIVYAIEALLDYLKDPSWENFGRIIQGIGVAIIGLGIVLGSIPLIVAGVVVLIVGTIIKYWEQIRSYLQGGIDWLKGKSDWVHNMFGDTIGSIYDMFVKNLQLILNWFDSTFTSIKGIFDGLIKFIKGVFTGNWKMAWEGIKQIFTNIWNIIKNTFLTVFNLIQNKVIVIGQTVGNLIASVFKGAVNATMGAIEAVLNSPINTINTMIGAINTLPRSTHASFTNI